MSFAVTWVSLRVLHSLISWINGGPFRTGDTVEILVGPHRGKTGRVYEEWTDRGQVRVDIEPRAAGRVEDVFTHIELVRTRNVDTADREPSPETGQTQKD